jgi:hypothetical protein
MLEREAGTAPDYHELNAGAHRKPPKTLTAPSLIWHLAFWTGFQELDEDGKPAFNKDGSPKKKSPEQIRAAVDRYVIGLYHALLSNGEVDERVAVAGTADQAEKVPKVELTPNVSGKYLLFKHAYDEKSFGENPPPLLFDDLNPRQKDIFVSTNRTVSLEFAWQQLDVTVSFEIRTEYFSISTFVEVKKDRKKADVLHPRIDAFDQSMKTMRDYLQDAGPATLPPDPRPAQINAYFFHLFWGEYEKKILPGELLAKIAGDSAFSQIFADFRGLVMSDEAVKFSDRNFFTRDRYPTWGRAAKNKFLSLIEHRNKELRIRYECAVNYMLDGRALYMSTLGPQFPAPPALDSAEPPANASSVEGSSSSQFKDKRIPVEFIVYAHQRYDDKTIVNKWQLGRLVNQILLLGRLRLSALKDIKFLLEAGQLLSQLDQSTQAARDAIAKTEEAKQNPETDAQEDPSAIPSDEKVMELIGNAHEKLNEITGSFLKATGTGLSYRIERSRYYVTQFDENVKLLRIKRLEGDQPYDQFIRRRLGSEFDLIDRLGIRYERATSNVVSLDQNFLAITQNRLVKQANRIDEDIHDIQQYGELFLLAALVPYYVTHLLVLILGEELAPVIAGNVWIGFVVLAIANFFKIWRKKWKLSALLEAIVSSPGKISALATANFSKIWEKKWELSALREAIVSASRRIWNYSREHASLTGTLVFVLVVGLAGWFAGPPFESWLSHKQRERQQQSLADTSRKILEAQEHLRKTVKDGSDILEKLLQVQAGSTPARETVVPAPEPAKQAPNARSPAEQPGAPAPGPNPETSVPDKGG